MSGSPTPDIIEKMMRHIEGPLTPEQKKALLIGPPGTGKSLILAAVRQHYEKQAEEERLKKKKYRSIDDEWSSE